MSSRTWICLGVALAFATLYAVLEAISDTHLWQAEGRSNPFSVAYQSKRLAFMGFVAGLTMAYILA